MRGILALSLNGSSAEERIPLTLTNLLNAKLVGPSPSRGEGKSGGWDGYCATGGVAACSGVAIGGMRVRCRATTKAKNAAPPLMRRTPGQAQAVQA